MKSIEEVLKEKDKKEEKKEPVSSEENEILGRSADDLAPIQVRDDEGYAIHNIGPGAHRKKKYEKEV